MCLREIKNQIIPNRYCTKCVCVCVALHSLFIRYNQFLSFSDKQTCLNRNLCALNQMKAYFNLYDTLIIYQIYVLSHINMCMHSSTIYLGIFFFVK